MAFFLTIISLAFSFSLWHDSFALASPPPEDIPEEVLATEIIPEVRSPLDNQPLTPEEYTNLTNEQRESKYPPQLNSKLSHTIFLLKLLNLMRKVSPF